MVFSDRICNLLEPCGTPEAPLCPLQDATIRNGIWYGDEPICQSETFANLPWIKKQKAIAALKLKADEGFFTVKMLNILKKVEPGIKGADPADDNAEHDWLKQYNIKPNTYRKRRSKQASSRMMATARLL
jgi:hypothetical protein